MFLSFGRTDCNEFLLGPREEDLLPVYELPLPPPDPTTSLYRGVRARSIFAWPTLMNSSLAFMTASCSFINALQVLFLASCSSLQLMHIKGGLHICDSSLGTEQLGHILAFSHTLDAWPYPKQL